MRPGPRCCRQGDLISAVQSGAHAERKPLLKSVQLRNVAYQHEINEFRLQGRKARPMNKYVTLVIRMPEDEAEKQQASEAIKALEPYRTAMSLGDEITVLDLIEQHPDFDEYIADEARAEARRLQEKK